MPIGLGRRTTGQKTEITLNDTKVSIDSSSIEPSVNQWIERGTTLCSSFSDRRNQPTERDESWLDKKRIPRHFHINQNRTKLSIIQGDITRISVDAIVNAANEHMTGGGGIDGVIHRAAGPKLLDECYLHRKVVPGVRLPTGRSRILFSYNLSKTISYIINTAGPVYSSYDTAKCAEQLSSCYDTAMALANLYDLKSIAFPAISCGIFGYPADDGAEQALRTADEKADQLSDVIFVLWDDHIYDAWVKKAKELKFTPFADHVSAEKGESRAEATADGDNHGVSSGNQFSTMKVKELGASNATDTDEDPAVRDAIRRLPSVPGDLSDTQGTVEMEEVDKAGSTTLDTQKTVEMRDNDPERSTTMETTTIEQKSVEATPDDSDRTEIEAAEVPPARKSSASLVAPTD